MISYLFDLLTREMGLPVEDVCAILSPPLWQEHGPGGGAGGGGRS